MAPLNWATYLERAVGKGHPTLSDTVNRALRQLLTESGYDPDATTFPGLFGPVANVKVYGAIGNGIADDTAAIQAAINTGLPVVFPSGVYLAVGLTHTANFQHLIGIGSAELKKAGNGVILASTASFFNVDNLGFRGSQATPGGFSGDNVNFTGAGVTLINCFSMNAEGRALKSTGDHIHIIGTGKGGVWQTLDASGTGYDLEIGVSGTPTLYHHLYGIYTSQSTGGIKTVECGALTILSSQFGKLTISPGAGGIGINGGSYGHNRILGDVTVDVSNAAFGGNAFGAVAITFGAGTSGHTIDKSNTFQSGHTIVNNGNSAILIERSIGVAGLIELKYGQDSAAAIFKITPSSGRLEIPNHLLIPNNTGAVTFKRFDGTDGPTISNTTANNLSLANPVSGGAIIATVAGSGSHSFDVNGGASRAAQFDDSGVAENTKCLLYDVTAGTLKRVSRGAADSGGAGFRVLRIPN